MSRHDIRRLVIYIVAKAAATAMPELFGDIEMAALQMWAVAQTNRKVTLPVYHFCLSWSALECPTNEQAIAAARRAIRALGAEAHQAVIGVHRDRDHVHVHVALARIHPETGKAFSTSHDYAKLEKVCREIEAEQGWSVDRGRFHAVTVAAPDGPQISLVPPSEETRAAKTARRTAGRGASETDLGRERQTGVPPLVEALSPAWKARVRAAIETAGTWEELHAGLEPLGLAYTKFGSGARFVLRGADAVLKPSHLGTACGLPALQKRLGPCQEPEPDPAPLPRATQPDAVPAPTPGATRSARDGNAEPLHLADFVATLTAVPVQPDDVRGLTRSETFKRTLLERTYTRITLDDDLVRAIRRVALDVIPPRIALQSGAEIRDEGNRIGTTGATDDDAQARIMVAMAVAKGWTRCRLTGSEAFRMSIARAAAGTGLVLVGLSPEIEATLAGKAAGTPDVTGGVPRTSDVAVRPETVEAPPHKTGGWPHDPADGSPADAPTSLPAPLDPHALRDAERARRREIREARRVVPLALAQSQAEERQRLADLLGNRRGPLEQAFRQALAGHQATERAEARALSRATESQDAALPPVPLDAAARRVRIAEAARTVDDRTCPVAAIDHTDCRQHWQGPASAPTDLCHLVVTAATIARFPDQVRSGPYGGIICAHRNASGSIVGFECLCDHPTTGWQEGIAPDGRAATFVIGDAAKAKTVYITATASDALGLAQSLDRSDALYVSIAGEPDEATMVRLVALAQRREVITYFPETETPEGPENAVHAALPWAETLRDVEAQETNPGRPEDADPDPEGDPEPGEEPEEQDFDF